MIKFIREKADLISLGVFVGVVSGMTIIISFLLLTKFGVIDKSYSRAELLLFCARNSISVKDCKI